MLQKLNAWLSNNVFEASHHTPLPPAESTRFDSITFHDGHPSSEAHVQNTTWLLKRTLYLAIFSLGNIVVWVDWFTIGDSALSRQPLTAVGMALLTVFTVLLWRNRISTQTFERAVAAVTGGIMLTSLATALYAVHEADSYLWRIDEVADFVGWGSALFVFYFILGKRYGLLMSFGLITLGIGVALPYWFNAPANDVSRLLLTRFFLTSPLQVLFLLALVYFIEHRSSVVGESNVWMSTTYYDSLTGLPNRRFLQRRVGDLLRQRQPFALLLLDIDDFKRFNDALGHRGGDTLLRHITRRLETAVPHHLFARVSSDEFAFVILATDRDTVLERTRWILDSFNHPFHVAHVAYELTGSVGIVFANDLPTTSSSVSSISSSNSSSGSNSANPNTVDSENAEHLLRHADIAVGEAKTLGKARYHIYAPSLGAKQARDLAIEHDLRDILANRTSLLDTTDAADALGLQLVFQPVVVHKTHDIRKFEVLLRWQHPELGVIPPSDFVTIAEKSSLIVALGQWVLQRACTYLAEWRDAGVWRGQFTLAVNVSAAQFLQQDLAAQIAAMLRDFALPTSALELEITETMAMSNLEHSIKQLNMLRDLGIGLALDDFGTGYASLASLHALPIDTVKIDQSFIRATSRANRQQQKAISMVRTMITLARALELAITAEGVETHEQQQLLEELECDYLQGYLFGRPCHAHHLSRVINRTVVDRMVVDRMVGKPLLPADTEPIETRPVDTGSIATGSINTDSTEADSFESTSYLSDQLTVNSAPEH